MSNRALIDGEIIFKWLDRILADRDWTPTRLAREIDVPPSTINKFYNGWKKDKPPAHVMGRATIMKVVDKLGVDPPPVAGVSYATGLRLIAVYSWAAAGEPGIIEGEAVGMEPIGQIYAQSRKADLFGVLVECSAINHDIPRGSVAVIDPNDRIPINQKYYLIQHAGRPRLRQYRADPARFEPNSTEPGHETVFPDRNTIVVGRVIEALREF